MQIQTNTFGINRNEYFWILIRNYFQKRLWFYALIYGFMILVTISIFILNLQIRLSYIVFMVYAILMPLYYLFWFWRHTRCKENAIFYRERALTISEDFLEATLDDGSIDKIRWPNILYYKKVKSGFLLYISKQQFIYIPNLIFRSNHDFNEFEAFIVTKLKEGK